MILEAQCQAGMKAIAQCLHDLEFRKATNALSALWTSGDRYIDDRAPWALFKENPEGAAMVVRTAINLIRIYAIAANPFMPATAKQIFDALQLSESERTSSLTSAVDFSVLLPDRPFEVPPPLFQKLDDDRVAQLRSIFGGE